MIEKNMAQACTRLAQICSKSFVTVDIWTSNLRRLLFGNTLYIMNVTQQQCYICKSSKKNGKELQRIQIVIVILISMALRQHSAEVPVITFRLVGLPAQCTYHHQGRFSKIVEKISVHTLQY